MRRLKLRHLEVLLAIAKEGSLTGAGLVLGASQPSVSQWLVDIEAALGVHLYERGRQLKPTPFLEPALRHARRMVNDSQRLQAEVAAIAAGGWGTVRLGAMHVGGPVLVPQAILHFKAESSQTKVELVEDIAAGLWPRFERDELDILVTRLDQRAYIPGVHREELYADPHCVIAGLRHPLLRKRRLEWTDASAYPWILPPTNTDLRRAIDATFIAESLTPPVAWLESVAVTANVVLLRETQCLAVVSTGLARYLKSIGAAGVIPLRLTSDLGPVGMIWREHELTPGTIGMLAALRHVAGRMIHH